MELIDQFIIQYITRDWRWLGPWEKFFFGAFMLAVLFGVIYFIFWALFVRYKYGTVQCTEGTVTNMDYTPSRTTTTMVGKTMTTQHHPAQHDVYIMDKDGRKWNFNHERLYQTVRLDDKVKITYQKQYKGLVGQPTSLYRYNKRRALIVTAPTGRDVEINNQKEIDHEVSRLNEHR